jgi:hypothetical protein
MTRREQDDRSSHLGRAHGHRAGHVPAITVGQHQDQFHQIGVPAAQDVQRCLSILVSIRRIAGLLQAGTQWAHSLSVIVYPEDRLVRFLRLP